MRKSNSSLHWKIPLLTFVLGIASTSASATEKLTCANLGTLTAPSLYGVDWNPAAYSIYSAAIDSAMQRSDFITEANDKLAVTKSFTMPFLTTKTAPGCQIIQPQVQKPLITKKTQAIQNIACPNSTADQTVIVQTALGALANYQANNKSQSGLGLPVQLNFAGDCTYYFYNATSLYNINLSGFNDLTVDGNGASLVFGAPTTIAASSSDGTIKIGAPPAASPPALNAFKNGFYIGGATTQRVLIENLTLQSVAPVQNPNGTIDWGVTFPQVDYAVVSAGQTGPATLTVAPNRKSGNTLFFPVIRESSLTDPTDPLLPAFSVPKIEMSISADVTSQIEQPIGAQLQFTAADNAGNSPWPNGSRVKLYHSSLTTSGNIFFIQDTDLTPVTDISIVSVNIINGPDQAILASMTKGLLLDHVNVGDPNSPDASSTGADAVVVQMASDLIIVDSGFYYQGDDGLNYTTETTNISSISGNTVTMNKPFESAPPGVEFTPCFADPDFEIVSCATAKVTAGGVKGQSFVYNNSDIAKLKAGYVVFRLDRPATRAFISGNTYVGSRARGMIPKGSNTYIYNNTIQKVSNGPIRVTPNNTAFTEGPLPRNFVITDNFIDGGGTDLNFGAIGTGVLAAKGLTPSSPVIQNVYIARNTIQNLIEPAIMNASTGYFVVSEPTPVQTVPNPPPKNGIWIANIDVTTYYSVPGSWWANNAAQQSPAPTLAPICYFVP